MQISYFYYYNKKIKAKESNLQRPFYFRLVHHCVPLLGRESQNERMVGVERDLWSSFCPTPLLKQSYLEQVAWDYVKTISEYLQGRKKKKVFPDVHTAPPTFQSVPIAPGPVTEHH